MNNSSIKNRNVILVDTSYTLFHRYFATLRWLSMAHNDLYKEHIDDKDYNWLENTIFKEKYEKLYLEGIIKLIGKRAFKDSIVIFCMDTPKEQVWRTELKCDYKSDRFDMSTKTNFAPTFKYTYNTIIPNLLKNNNFFKIRLEKLEADDIIATIVNHLEPINYKIFLVSGDEDFLQLAKPNLYYVNFKKKKPYELTRNEGQNALHKKLLLGDKSDCIKSIFPPKFPSKVKKMMLESIEYFNENLKNYKELEPKYNLNSNLIDFRKIPTAHVKTIISELNKFKIN